MEWRHSRTGEENLLKLTSYELVVGEPIPGAGLGCINPARGWKRQVIKIWFTILDFDFEAQVVPGIKTLFGDVFRRLPSFLAINVEVAGGTILK
jgi:hypothetical protein